MRRLHEPVWFRAALVLAVCAAMFKACSRDEWMGYVYPNKSDLSRHIAIGPYESLEACRQAAIGALRTTFTPPGDYECGLNCKTRADMAGMNVCDRTER